MDSSGINETAVDSSAPYKSIGGVHSIGSGNVAHEVRGDMLNTTEKRTIIFTNGRVNIEVKHEHKMSEGLHSEPDGLRENIK